MPTVEIVVFPPKGVDGDWKHKDFECLAVPAKGQSINLGAPGTIDGPDVRVVDVKHWFGIDEISVYCRIDADEKFQAQTFAELTEARGWED